MNPDHGFDALPMTQEVQEPLLPSRTQNHRGIRLFNEKLSPIKRSHVMKKIGLRLGPINIDQTSGMHTICDVTGNVVFFLTTMGSTLSSVSSAFIEQSNGTYNRHPTEDDVTSVRDMFQTHLPLELINLILDFAEYWPCVHCDSNRKADVLAPGGRNAEATYLYLVSPPIPDGGGRHRKIRKVIFQTESHDQGWVDNPQIQGTYKDSWSWFEAMIFRDSSSSCHLDPINLGVNYSSSDLKQLFPQPDPNGWLVQNNVVASKEPQRHTVTWTKSEDEAAHQDPSSMKGREGLGHELVRSLEPGDRVMLIAKARFPRWANYISNGSIEIYYSI